MSLMLDFGMENAVPASTLAYHRVQVAMKLQTGGRSLHLRKPLCINLARKDCHD